MPIKRYKPTTAGRRGASVLVHAKEGVQTPVRGLVGATKKRNSGRNNTGRVTVRHQGGGHKRKFRVIDFTNPIEDKPAKVIGIQYDPNRSSAIALVLYKDGTKAYTLAVKDVKVGDTVETSRKRALGINLGNRMAIKHIPAGIMINSIELAPNKGVKAVRSAGSNANVMSVEGDYVLVKMPSGEIRKFYGDCLATVGQVSNSEKNLVRLGKAGRMRHRGVRPTVAGKAMNAVDHPHGGGEGHSPIGLKMPKTPWGKPALGVKTRKAHKASDVLIVRRRKRKK